MSQDRMSLQGLLGNRNEFIKAIVSGTILGLGLNLIASATATLATIYLDENAAGQSRTIQWVILGAGLVLATGAVGYIGRNYLSRRTIRVSAKGAVFFNSRDGSLVDVPTYEFSNRLIETLNAAFQENQAFKTTWETDPIVKPAPERPRPQSAAALLGEENPVTYFAITRTDDDEKVPTAEPKSAILMREAIEFVLLEILSTHLSDYFSHLDNVQRFVKEYVAADIPKFLTSNRILSLLSTPIEDRAIFLKMKIRPPKGEIVKVYGSDGSMYSRFDLVLPKDVSITRPEPTTVLITSKRLSIRMSFEFHPYSISVPSDFLALFANVQDPKAVTTRVVDVQFEATVRPKALFAGNGWDLYRWVDTFAKELIETVDFKHLLETRTHWTVVSAVLRSETNQARRARGVGREKPEDRVAVAAEPGQ